MTQTLIEKLEAVKQQYNTIDEQVAVEAVEECIAVVRQHEAEQWQPLETAPENIDVLCKMERRYAGKIDYFCLVGHYCPDRRSWIDYLQEELNYECRSGYVNKVVAWQHLPPI